MPTLQQIRKHPKHRLGSSVQIVGLTDATTRLRAEMPGAVRDYRQIAITRHGDVTIILVAFNAGGIIKEHRTSGLVTIHVLSGRLNVELEDGFREVGPSELVTLAPQVRHAIRALESSEILLYVHRVGLAATPAALSAALPATESGTPDLVAQA